MEENSQIDLFEILAELPELRDDDRRTLLKMASARSTDLALREQSQQAGVNQVAAQLATHIDEIEAIRLQMVAVAAAARVGDVSLLERFFGVEESRDDKGVLSSPPRTSAVEEFAGGLKSCFVMGVQVILMPAPRSNLHCWQILNALNKLSLSAARHRPWIIDCSAIVAQEALIYSSLLAYQKSFQKEHQGIKLIWVNPDSLPQLIYDRLVEEFKLERVGSHYFSK